MAGSIGTRPHPDRPQRRCVLCPRILCIYILPYTIIKLLFWGSSCGKTLKWKAALSAAWRNLAGAGASQWPVTSPRAAAAVGTGGSGGFASGGGGGQPWNEAGLPDRHHGHHTAKAKNAEITPVEVNPPA